MENEQRQRENVLEKYDKRGIALACVGIEQLSSRVKVVTDGDNSFQETIALIGVYGNLSPFIKGASPRLFEETAFHFSESPITSDSLTQAVLDVHKHLVERSEGYKGHKRFLPWAGIKLDFPLFFQRQTPASKISYPLDFACRLEAKTDKNETQVTYGVTVPVMTVCPDSLELSQLGAHSQRSLVSIEAYGKSLSFENLVNIAESSGSSPVYSVMSREDDAQITQKAFSNPKFAEDVVRDAVLLLNLQHIDWKEVWCKSFESNRGHNLLAKAAREKRR